MTMLYEVLENAPLFMPKRMPTSESDFGDTRTVGLKLKTSGKSFEKLGDHDFAMYLGFYKDMWYVGTHKVLEFFPSQLIGYDSLDDLKCKWILD